MKVLVINPGATSTKVAACTALFPPVLMPSATG